MHYNELNLKNNALVIVKLITAVLENLFALAELHNQ